MNVGYDALLIPAFWELTGCIREETVAFASPSPVWWNAVPVITALRGAFKRDPKGIRNFDVSTGVASKEAVVQGNADVGVCAANALATSSKEQLSKLAVLACITRSSGTVSMIAEGKRLDLPRSKIGYVKGTISEFYLISYLRQQKQLALYNKLDLKALPPFGVPPAFDKKDINVALPWEPFAETLIRACKKMNREILVIRDPTLYEQQILLVASQKALAEKRPRVEKFARLIQGTCAEIEGQRGDAASDLEKFFKFERGFISESDAWKQTSFYYVTDKKVIEKGLHQDFELAAIGGISQGATMEELVTTLDI